MRARVTATGLVWVMVGAIALCGCRSRPLPDTRNGDSVSYRLPPSLVGLVAQWPGGEPLPESGEDQPVVFAKDLALFLRGMGVHLGSGGCEAVVERVEAAGATVTLRSDPKSHRKLRDLCFAFAPPSPARVIAEIELLSIPHDLARRWGLDGLPATEDPPFPGLRPGCSLAPAEWGSVRQRLLASDGARLVRSLSLESVSGQKASVSESGDTADDLLDDGLEVWFCPTVSGEDEGIHAEISVETSQPYRPAVPRASHSFALHTLVAGLAGQTILAGCAFENDPRRREFLGRDEPGDVILAFVTLRFPADHRSPPSFADCMDGRMGLQVLSCAANPFAPMKTRGIDGDDAEEEAEDEDPKEFFSQLGAKFPKGSLLYYDLPTSLLVSYNTPLGNRQIRAILAPCPQCLRAYTEQATAMACWARLAPSLWADLGSRYPVGTTLDADAAREMALAVAQDPHSAWVAGGVVLGICNSDSHRASRELAVLPPVGTADADADAVRLGADFMVGASLDHDGELRLQYGASLREPVGPRTTSPVSLPQVRERTVEVSVDAGSEAVPRWRVVAATADSDGTALVLLVGYERFPAHGPGHD